MYQVVALCDFAAPESGSPGSLKAASVPPASHLQRLPSHLSHLVTLYCILKTNKFEKKEGRLLERPRGRGAHISRMPVWLHKYKISILRQVQAQVRRPRAAPHLARHHACATPRGGGGSRGRRGRGEGGRADTNKTIKQKWAARFGIPGGAESELRVSISKAY